MTRYLTGHFQPPVRTAIEAAAAALEDGDLVVMVTPMESGAPFTMNQVRAMWEAAFPEAKPGTLSVVELRDPPEEWSETSWPLSDSALVVEHYSEEIAREGLRRTSPFWVCTINEAVAAAISSFNDEWKSRLGR